MLSLPLARIFSMLSVSPPPAFSVLRMRFSDRKHKHYTARVAGTQEPFRAAPSATLPQRRPCEKTLLRLGTQDAPGRSIRKHACLQRPNLLPRVRSSPRPASHSAVSSEQPALEAGCPSSDNTYYVALGSACEVHAVLAAVVVAGAVEKRKNWQWFGNTTRRLHDIEEDGFARWRAKSGGRSEDAAGAGFEKCP